MYYCSNKPVHPIFLSFHLCNFQLIHSSTNRSSTFNFFC
uniref:Uncharacterized protein n=1 Tax=Arundo donax TaxID=35708 RepID=A0A0A9GKV5_ARUDO